MKKRALITGIRGQDGAYLAKLLLEKGYEVIGSDRRSGDSTFWRLRELGIYSDVKVLYMDMLELTNIIKTIEKTGPDEIYNMAAQSFVATSFEQPMLTSDINALGTLRLLEAIRLVCPEARFYQASTSEMFGNTKESPQDENTPFSPRSPYGISKLFAYGMTVNYREAYSLFACNGISFNHESPLRGIEFVTRKISQGVARIKHGTQDPILLGNLDAGRDWGFAGDYVMGMWKMLQMDKPDDYVLATGESHSIREFVEAAFKVIGIKVEWTGRGIDEEGIDPRTGKELIQVSKDFFRPADIDFLIGNPGKARKVLEWEPAMKFHELVRFMVEEDIKNFERNVLN